MKIKRGPLEEPANTAEPATYLRAPEGWRNKTTYDQFIRPVVLDYIRRHSEVLEELGEDLLKPALIEELEQQYLQSHPHYLQTLCSEILEELERPKL